MLFLHISRHFAGNALEIMPTASATPCYHCGTDCPRPPIRYDDKDFCCEGCKAVYTLLNEHQLCQYYSLEATPGSSPRQSRMAFLDQPDVAAQLLTFASDTRADVTFYIPTIHCSSCLYLLENLYRIEPGIKQARVDFLKKQVHLSYQPDRISLRQVAELLTSLGYEPLISLNDVVQQQNQPTYRPLLYRLGVAGFCAGNIMLFSFPEYLGLDDPVFRKWFGLISLLLSLPVVFFSASGYFTSVWQSLRRGIITIDLPVLLGILAAFLRSAYVVLAEGGSGYFDSLSGLIFLLLCGKWFQQRTFDFLSFDRNYTSYFPLAVTRLTYNPNETGTPAAGTPAAGSPAAQTPTETPTPVANLHKGDRIRIRQGELIPADALLYRGEGRIDYSFVTGESAPETKAPGALVYAGGRQTGEAIDLEIVRETSQSYLTQLWNNDVFKKTHSTLQRFADTVGRYFTVVVLLLATAAALYWWQQDTDRAVSAFTAILIVACPCALALSYPFALGNGLRLLSQRRFYLKNADVVEQLAACDTIVFDKTGTLTIPSQTHLQDHFDYPLTAAERAQVGLLARQSAHPLSRQLAFALPAADAALQHLTEHTGQGVEARIGSVWVRIGSAAFAGAPAAVANPNASVVHVRIGQTYRGYFSLQNVLRPHMDTMLQRLANTHTLYLLTGDSDSSRAVLTPYFSAERLFFGQKPQQKLEAIKTLQAAGHRVLMVGDGLNDAGALQQADVGLAVTDNTLHFTPASDAILEASALAFLPDFWTYSRFAMRLIRFSFGVSLLYNVIGLSFALTGDLSPLVAAILMPLSSATMLLIATIGMVSRGKKLPAVSEQIQPNQPRQESRTVGLRPVEVA